MPGANSARSKSGGQVLEYFKCSLKRLKRLLQWLSNKESACDAEAIRDAGSIPGLGRFPGGGNDNPLQYSCLENPMDREGWRATVHGVEKSRT